VVSRRGDPLARLIKKTLYVGFFAFLIGNFNGLAKIVFNSFSGLGLKAAGSGLSADQFLQPGRIAQVGIDAGWPILQAVSSLVGFTAIINPGIWLQLAVLLVAFLVVLGSFFVLAIQLFVTLIEFKLTTLAGFVLVPFGLFGHTAFLAERVLGNVVASGVKILVLDLRVRRQPAGIAGRAGHRAGSAVAARSRHLRSGRRDWPCGRGAATRSRSRGLYRIHGLERRPGCPRDGDGGRQHSSRHQRRRAPRRATRRLLCIGQRVFERQRWRRWRPGR
jgi:type IV secretory pathway TrbL component